MKKSILLATVYGALAAWPVGAADLPAKANAVAPREVPVCGSGFYFGINTMGSAGAVDNSPVPGASIVQAELGATIGYTSTVGGCNPMVPLNPFWFVEGRFDWTNLNGATNGLALTGPIHLQQRVGYGTPAITQVLSAIPGLGGLSTPSLPVLPAGTTSIASVPYLYLAANEQDISAQIAAIGLATGRTWEVSPELGIGMWNRLSNQVVVDVNAGYRFRSGGVCFGGTTVCPGPGGMWTAGVSFNF